MSNIPIEVALTDSLSLKIPLEECEIIDKRLTSRTSIYYEDLNEVDEISNPPKPLLFYVNYATIRIGLVSIPKYDTTKRKKIPKEYISLTVSSKLLKNRYFEGINKETIRIVYDAFIAYNVFTCTYETFLNGIISDIDVCYNSYFNSPENFSEMLSVIQQITQNYKHLVIPVNEKYNVGLSLNTRDKAKPSLPFCKFYFKYFELLHNQKTVEFYNTYLFHEFSEHIVNLGRVECTIKNYEHKRRLVKYEILPNFKTLQEYLDIPQENLLKFIQFSLSSYVTKLPRKRNVNLSPTDFLLYNLIYSSVLNGADLFQILEFVEEYDTQNPKSDQVAKTRLRKKVKQLFALLKNEEKYLEKKLKSNEKINQYLKNLGICPF